MVLAVLMVIVFEQPCDPCSNAGLPSVWCGRMD